MLRFWYIYKVLDRIKTTIFIITTEFFSSLSMTWFLPVQLRSEFRIKRSRIRNGGVCTVLHGGEEEHATWRVTREPGQESEGPWPLGTQVTPRQAGVWTWAQGAQFPGGCGERYPAESTEARFVQKTTRNYHREMTWWLGHSLKNQSSNGVRRLWGGYLGERGLSNPAMAVWMQAEAHRWKGDSFEKIINDLVLSVRMPEMRFLIVYEFRLLMGNLVLVV